MRGWWTSPSGSRSRKASVTNMVQRLDAEGLLKYEKFRGLVLTTAGEALTRNITHRHQLLTDFLKLLGLDDEVIYHDVEGMEHHISPPDAPRHRGSDQPSSTATRVAHKGTENHR